MGCVFCDRVATSELVAAGELAVAFGDAFPVSRGHVLVVPRRHEPSFFALSPEEQAAAWRLVADVIARVGHELRPDGYTVGINAGEAAWQTVAHAHVHVIPRFRGDVLDPRGGVRWVLPERARYWDQ